MFVYIYVNLKDGQTKVLSYIYIYIAAGK